MKTRIVFFLVVSALVISTGAAAYPKPRVVQKVDQWTLNIEYTSPKQITLQLPDQKEPQRFWYIILSVTNKTSLEAVDFYPVCQLVTDTFQVIPADKNVPVLAFNAIKKEYQGSYPFLESLDFKDHRIVRGKDNTRDFAIIWPDFDPQAKQISLFIGGLSNETAVVEDPVRKNKEGNPKKIFLQKTLQLKYAIAGDERLRASATPKQIKQTWVMR